MSRKFWVLAIISLADISASNMGYIKDPIKKTVYHMLNFNKYLFTHPDSLKIIAGAAPPYGIARILDDTVHHCFYCPRHHKNVNQCGCNKKTFLATDVFIGLEIASLMLLSMVAPHDEERVVSHVFISSYPFALAYKDVFKDFLQAIKGSGSCRPKCEYYSCKKSVYNGFPSGHMMEVAFMATLFGKLGFRYAVPLWTFAGIVATQLIVINRHTLSQVVAGTTLGVLFGAAAQKAACHAMNRKQNWDIVIDRSGRLALSYEYEFS